MKQFILAVEFLLSFNVMVAETFFAGNENKKNKTAFHLFLQ